MPRTALAQALSVAPATFAHWEKGRRSMPEDARRGLAKLAGLTPRFFEVEPDEVVVAAVGAEDCNYRSLVRTPAHRRVWCEGYASVVNLVVDWLVGIVPEAFPPLRLGEDAGEFEVGPSAMTDRSPHHAALQLRSELGLGLDPLPNAIGLVESLGAVVAVMPITDAPSIDALSLNTGARPLVLLSHEKRNPYRTRFDTCHELGHLILGHDRSTRVEKNGRRRRSPDPQAEKEANTFAGELLVPMQAWLLASPRTTNPYGFMPYRDHWGVSAGALMYRARQAGVLTEKTYRTAMVRYSQAGFRGGEPDGPLAFEVPSTLRKAAAAACRRLRTDRAGLARAMGLGLSLLDTVIGSGPDLERSNVIAFRGARPKPMRETLPGPEANLELLLKG